MDSQQLFRCGVTAAGLSYPTSYSTFPASLPYKLFTDLKSDSRNSPNSPFSSQFDCDSIASSTDSQGQQSCADNFDGVSSYNSPQKSSSYFYQATSSVNRLPSGLSHSSSGLSSVQNVNPNHKIESVLLELETALMAPEDEEEVSRPQTFGDQQPRTWSQGYHVSVLKPQPSFLSRDGHRAGAADSEKRQKTTNESSLQDDPSGNLKQLLIACAKALAEHRMEDFDKLVGLARGVVSITGEPIQRLGAYMVEGLVARREESGSNIYHALKCREPSSTDLLSYMHILYEICPYLKFGYMAANGAIAEACRIEDRIHIIDFQIAQGSQWVTLLPALAARPGGAPFVRITGIDDPVSEYARGAGLEVVGRRLAALSEKFNIPIEFHALPVFAPQVTRDMLEIRPGETVVANFPLQLHHTPDESVEMNNPRDGLLRLVKSLSPKVTTLVEQEANTNTAPFLPRFIETLQYYSAMFESIDVTLPRDMKERISVEQHCLARDIVNIIACEGKERVERYELLGKWKSRLTMAGFQQVPLSPYVNSVIKALLRNYSEHYTLIEKDGAMLLGWKNRNLISASAWI